MKELLFCSIILFPGVKWFLTPGRFNPKVAFQYAAIFFFASSVAYVAYDLKSTEASYYEFLGVSRLSGLSAIKSRYRELSLQFHPDRPNAPRNANEIFTLLSTAYETLSDPVRRRAYDTFGFQFLGQPTSSPAITAALKSIETHDAAVLFFSYVFPFYFGTALVTFLLTIQTEKQKARTFGLVVLGLIAGLDAYFKILCDDASANEVLNVVLPEVAVFKKIEFCRKMYHFILQGLILWSEWTYFDVNKLLIQILAEMHQNQQILMRMVFNATNANANPNANKLPAAAAAAAAAAAGGVSLNATSSTAAAAVPPNPNPHASADADTATATASGEGKTDAKATAAAAAGAKDPFVAFMQSELKNQHRFLQAQSALAQAAPKQGGIPWGSLIFLAIAALNFWKR